MSLVVLIGVTGSGKTTVGRILADSYRLELHEVDRAVEAKLKASMRSLVVRRDARPRGIPTPRSRCCRRR